MTEIYNDYSDEPEDHFQPISDELSSSFYNLEMSSFTEDISFYYNRLPQKCSVLELGCGSGRLTHHLTTPKRQFVGIDLNLNHIHHAVAQKRPDTNFLVMDMKHLAFMTKFTAIIAAYNTLNLLISTENITACLSCSKKALLPGGNFLAQIFVPPEDLLSSDKKSFQFQIFNRPSGGKVIKEILKTYHNTSKTIQVEERYRVRPMQENQPNEDWSLCYSIAALSVDNWLDLFNQSGFKAVEIFKDYDCTTPAPPGSSNLLAHFVI